MVGWREVLTHYSVDAENFFDLLKYRLREHLGGRNPIMILPYRGFGTQKRLYLRGRVLEDRGITSATDNDSVWVNMLNMWRRAKSLEIPYARVRARYGDEEQVVTANIEGFFEVWMEPRTTVDEKGLWREVELQLVSPLRDGAEPVMATGEILVPPASAEFVVISDIDDTVLQTDATSLLRMARAAFLGNARIRLPFQGVAAFYRALHGGSTSHALNPMFYVSSSPWNLYDLLSDFFNLRGIPIGPVLFLRDWGLSEEGFLPIHNRAHKLVYIKQILETYAQLPFILIGDSGQEDPEIYAEVALLYPNRIRAVYIRNVSRDPGRVDRIKALAEEVLKAGSVLILAETTLPLAEHAAKQHWIDPNALPEIEIEKQADAAPPTPIETLLGKEAKAEAPVVEVAPGEGAEETIEAVQSGGIEEALQAGDAEKEEAPTVVVKPDDDGDRETEE
jgi:phosphatidate phosphatase APP1